MLNHFSYVPLFATLWAIVHQASLSVGFSGKNTGVGCIAFFQGIFLTKRSNPHFLYLSCWQEGSLPLEPPGKSQTPSYKPRIRLHCLIVVHTSSSEFFFRDNSYRFPCHLLSSLLCLAPTIWGGGSRPRETAIFWQKWEEKKKLNSISCDKYPHVINIPMQYLACTEHKSRPLFCTIHRPREMKSRLCPACGVGFRQRERCRADRRWVCREWNGPGKAS